MEGGSEKDQIVTFDDWIESIGGLTEGGRIQLEEATVVSLAWVWYLTDEDIFDIQLSVGDRSILKAGTASLRSLVVPEVKQIEVKQFPVAASTMPGFPVGVSMGKR